MYRRSFLFRVNVKARHNDGDRSDGGDGGELCAIPQDSEPRLVSPCIMSMCQDVE